MHQGGCPVCVSVFAQRIAAPWVLQARPRCKVRRACEPPPPPPSPSSSEAPREKKCKGMCKGHACPRRASEQASALKGEGGGDKRAQRLGVFGAGCRGARCPLSPLSRDQERVRRRRGGPGAGAGGPAAGEPFRTQPRSFHGPPGARCLPKVSANCVRCRCMWPPQPIAPVDPGQPGRFPPWIKTFFGQVSPLSLLHQGWV